MAIFKYNGAIHIHSTLSDGTGDVFEISKAAKKAGLDFIIITDHNNFDIQEGLINDVLVINGEEISPNNGNHYLAFDIKNCIKPDEPKKYVEEVRSQGGFGFWAHPDEIKNRKNNFKSLFWQDKSIEPDGVEIWNWLSQWGDNYNSTNIFMIIYSYLFRHNLISKPYSETIKSWDELNNKYEKIVPAICGVDAHALKITKYILPVKIFPYYESFKTLTNEIILYEELSTNFEIAKKQILNSIKNGKNNIINKHISKEDVEIYIENKIDKAYSGSEIDLYNETYLYIKTKNKYKMNVIKNGKDIYSIIDKEMKLKLTEKGKYRVELLKRDKGFFYTNPIIIK